MAQDSRTKMLTIERPLGGFISDLWGVPNAALQGQAGQYTIGIGASMMRKEKVGHIAPAEIFNVGSITDSSPYFNSLPRALAVDVTQTPNVYWYITGGLAGTAPRLVKVVSGATTTSHDITAINNFTTLPATGFWGEDILFYTGAQSSAPVPMILYFWNDSGTGACGMYNISSSSFVSDDFFSTTYFSGKSRPTAGVPHRAWEGPDKVAYFTNGQYVGSYDGNDTASNANGNYNPQALNLGTGWIGVDGCKYQNYNAILCVKNGTAYNSYTSKSEAKVVLWDGFSLDFNFFYDVQDNYASALFNADQLYCFSQGVNNTTKIKSLPIAQGVSKFQTLYENSTSLIGNAPDPRSIALYNGQIVWWGTSPNNSGALSAYIPQVGYHEPYLAHDGSVIASLVGFLGNATSNQLHIGIKAGSTYKVAYLDGTGGYATTADFRTQLIDIPYGSTIKRINLYFSQFSSTSSLLVSMFRDYNSVSIGGATDLLNATISQTTKPELKTRSYCSIIQTIENVSSFYINFRFNHSAVTNTAAIIRKVEVFYEAVDNP